MNLTLARPPNDSPSTSEINSEDQSGTQIPENGVVNGLILYFPIPDDIPSNVPVELEKVTAMDDTSSTTGEQLVRKKRFVFNIVGSALQSLRSDNWRECGRTSSGTTIYTNGIGTACFGSCPEYVRCGYGYNRYDGYDGNDSYGWRYRSQINTINFG